MQLTVFTDYGLRSLIYLAEHHNRLCSVREIAEHYKISTNHLVKVIHKLSQLGHIIGMKGKGGGIKLAYNSKDMLLGDIILQLEPNMNLVECFDSKTNTCQIISVCKLKHYLAEANQAFIQCLNKYTLADASLNRNILK